MNKKKYLIPQISLVTAESELMNGNSYFGQGTQDGDPVVGGIDNSSDDNRSRMGSIWDDEEDW